MDLSRAGLSLRFQVALNWVNTTSRQGIKQLEVSSGSIFFYFPLKVAGGNVHGSRGNPRPSPPYDSPARGFFCTHVHLQPQFEGDCIYCGSILSLI